MPAPSPSPPKRREKAHQKEKRQNAPAHTPPPPKSKGKKNPPKKKKKKKKKPPPNHPPPHLRQALPFPTGEVSSNLTAACIWRMRGFGQTGKSMDTVSDSSTRAREPFSFTNFFLHA